MKTKNTVKILILLGLLILTGCSRKITSVVYYNPAWTADGKIISVKETRTGYETGGFGGGSSGYDMNSYLVTMDTDGTNEKGIMELGKEKYPKINCSPKGTYYALKGLNTNKTIDIYSFSNNEKISSITTAEEIISFDWNPDETKIVIYTSGNTTIYLLNGTKQNELTLLLPQWKYQQNILGYQGDPLDSYESILKETGEVVATADSFGINQYFPDGKSYFGGFKKISVPSFNIIENYAALEAAMGAKDDWYDPQINPINPEQLMFSDWYETIGAKGSVYGIVLINLDGSGKKIIK